MQAVILRHTNTVINFASTVTATGSKQFKPLQVLLLVGVVKSVLKLNETFVTYQGML